MSMESRFTRASDLQVRVAHDGASVITGLGIVYGKISQDLGGFVEVIDHAAARKTLGDGAKNVYASFNHNPDHILGRVSAGTLRLSNGVEGLQYEVDPSTDSPVAQHVLSAVRRGDVEGSSFTFRLAGDGDTWDVLPDGQVLRTVKELRLYELGPVVNPAYLDTTSQARSVLSGLATSRGVELEEVLRCAQEGHLRQVVEATVETVSEDVHGLGTGDTEGRQEPGNHSDRLAVKRARLVLARKR